MSSQQPTEAPAALAPTPIRVRIEESEGLMHRVRDIYHAISHRAHHLFERRGHTHGRDLDDWLQAESELLQPITVEVTDGDDAVTVRAWVPSFHASQLEVWVEPSRLVITGRSEEKTDHKFAASLYSEEEYREAYSSLALPYEIDTTKATAVLDSGVLDVTLPKASSTEKGEVQVEIE